MKTTVSVKHPNGKHITVTKDDGGAKAQGQGNLAAKGQHGDTELAHVNPYEEMLLKALGGAGTRNPKTGLKQFYTTGSDFTNDIGSWYQNAFGREADPEGLAFWQNADATSGLTDDELFNEFLKGGSAETYSNWTPDQPVPSTATATSPMFDFPLDLAPSSSSYSGLPKQYQSQLLDSIMPTLNSAVTNMEPNIDKYTQEALNSYQMAMDNALKKNIPLAVNNIANRGIIDSTAGNQVLADVINSARSEASTKGYETALEAAKLKANMPSILASIAELGKSQSSSQTDPTAMYQIMANMITAMM